MKKRTIILLTIALYGAFAFAATKNSKNTVTTVETTSNADSAVTATENNTFYNNGYSDGYAGFRYSKKYDLDALVSRFERQNNGMSDSDIELVANSIQYNQGYAAGLLARNEDGKVKQNKKKITIDEVAENVWALVEQIQSHKEHYQDFSFDWDE